MCNSKRDLWQTTTISIFYKSTIRAFASDPNTTLIKLRQLGEALAQDIVARSGVAFDAKTTQENLLFKLERQIRLDRTINGLFRTLRIEGNKRYTNFILAIKKLWKVYVRHGRLQSGFSSHLVNKGPLSNLARL